MRDFPQEVSSDPLSEDHELNANGIIPQRLRFAFAQKRVKRPTDANVNQIPVAHTHRSPVDRSRIPIPIKATLDTVPRVAGPRPCRSKPPFRARREPTLAVPKPVHPLPTWLTHFEAYENEFLTEFCPPSKDSSPSTSSFPSMARVELPSEHFPECCPLSTVPLLGFADSDLGLSDTGFGGGCSEEGGDCYEEDGDYVPFEFSLATRSTRGPPELKRQSDQDWPSYTFHAVSCGDSIDEGNIATRAVFDEFIRVTKDVTPMCCVLIYSQISSFHLFFVTITIVTPPGHKF